MSGGEVMRKTIRRSTARTGLSCALALAALVVLLVPALSHAAPAGSLDHSFGGDGKVLLKDLTGYAESVEVGRHGRIVAAGFSGNQFASGADFAVARLRSNGHLDRSFSHDGMKTTPFGNLARANDVAVDRRGGIIAAGDTCTDRDNCEAAVVRYKRNGRLNRSFSGDGKLSLDFERGRGIDFASSVEIDSQGRFVVAGGGCLQGVPSCDVVVTRLKRNGAIDRDFTGRAKAVYTDFNAGPAACPESSGATGMQVDYKDRVIAAGTCDGRDIGLVRLRRGGHVDPRFGEHGVVRSDLGFDDGAEDVALDSRSRIIVSGAVRHRGFAVARFHSDGLLGRSFGNNGRATAKAGGAGNALAVDSRNRIVVAGGGGHAFVFARFKSNGLLDRSFRDGAFAVGKDWGYGWALGVTTDRRDRIVGSGFKKRRFALVRLHG
jgi:uncharacterized delta-60 repeat protein